MKSNADTAARNGTGPGFLERALEERWRRFSLELARCRRRASEPGIHDLRVAARRLLAVLDLADAVLPGEAAPRARRSLRRCLKAFSPLRDCHVRILTLRGLTRRYTVARPLLGEARALERTLVREAGRVIGRFNGAAVEREIAAIALSLAALEQDPPRALAAVAVLRGVAARRYLRVEARRGRLAAHDTRTVHRLRIAFKEFRYTIEALLPLFPGMGKPQLRAMNHFQDRMGEIQDTEILIDTVTRFALRRGASFPRSVLNLERTLAGRRHALVESFLSSAGASSSFWPPAALRASSPLILAHGKTA